MMYDAISGVGGVSAFVKYEPLSVKPTDIEEGTVVIFSPRSRKYKSFLHGSFTIRFIDTMI